ncbi:MAG TPA: sugar transferase, partial [Bacteroidota bacterium]
FQPHSYPAVYTIPAVIVVWSLYAAGVYTHRRMSITRTMVGVVVSSVIISAVVAFFKDYAFSRAVIILSGAMSFILLPGWRLVARLSGGKSAGRKGLFGRRTLIVGTDAAAQKILRRIRTRVADGYEVLGFIDTTRKRLGEQLAGLPILGSSDNVGKIIDELRISDVIFSTQTLSYSDILSVIGRAGGRAVNFQIVPNSLEVMIGKASVDSLDNLPLVPISYNIETPQNRALKRMLDIGLSILLLISVYPFVYLRRAASPASYSHALLLLPSVLSGKLSFVGPPVGFSSLIQTNGRPGQTIYIGKPGLTGLVQLQASRTLTVEEIEQYSLFYARNQSLLLDIEILLKSLFRSTRNGYRSDLTIHEKRKPRIRTRRRTLKGGR